MAQLIDPTTVRELVGHVAGRRPDLIELCGALVARPSVNPVGDTRGVADVVLGFLTAHGLEAEVLRADPSMPNVVASVQGGRPGPHLVLNAHMDTMPPGDTSLWTVPPFELTERDGRLYGLGMGNMKGALAGMLIAFAALCDRRESLAGTLTLTAVSDEVAFGSHGAAHLLAERPELRGDALLSGEGPGERRLAVAEKGVCWLELSVTAEGGHSSAVRTGRSATARLAKAVTLIDALTGRRAELPAELRTLAVDAGDPGLLVTANVGTMSAGTFVGQIATDGRAEVDLRIPPGMTMSGLEAEITQLAGEGAVVRRIKGWDPNWTTPDDAFVAAARWSITQVTGSTPRFAVRLPASDASRWRALGVPAVCFGPQPGLSAGVDDYAEIGDVVDCAAGYALTAAAYLARP